MKPTECPHLGLASDATSALAYPSVGNYCSRCTPARSPRLAHQETYCLSMRYDECPLFQTAEGTAIKMPAGLASVAESPGPTRRRLGWVLVLMGFLLLAFWAWLNAPEILANLQILEASRVGAPMAGVVVAGRPLAAAPA